MSSANDGVPHKDRPPEIESFSDTGHIEKADSATIRTTGRWHKFWTEPLIVLVFREALDGSESGLDINGWFIFQGVCWISLISLVVLLAWIDNFGAEVTNACRCV